MILKQYLKCTNLALPEKAWLHKVVSIWALVSCDLVVANVRSQPILSSPPYCTCASVINIKYPSRSGTLCGCFTLMTSNIGTKSLDPFKDI